MPTVAAKKATNAKTAVHATKTAAVVSPAAPQRNEVKPALVKAVVSKISPLLEQLVNDALKPAARVTPIKRSTAKPDAPGTLKHGIKYPDQGTVTAQLWELFDSVGHACTLAQARQLALDSGLNEKSASIAIYNWRRYNGIKNRG